MRLVVQKYGGTSVGTPERIRKVARRLIETQRDGCQVVAFISAMAGVTDSLLKLAQEISPEPTKRELDILLSTGERAASALTAMAVNALGGRAISLTGAQAGRWISGANTGRGNHHLGTRRLRFNGYSPGRRAQCRGVPDFY